MKHIGLITTLWGRPKLTRVFLEYYNGLKIPGVRFWGACACEEGTGSEALYAGNLWRFVAAPNTPRSDKWNAAVSALSTNELDGALIVGSDDFLSPAYISEALRWASKGKDYITPTGCYFYDIATGRFGFGRFNRVGAGRYLSRRVLELCNYQPWLPGCHRNSDYAMGQVVNDIAKPYLLDTEDLPMLDVKTGNNIWSFDRVSSGAVSWRSFEGAYFDLWAKMHFPSLPYEMLTNLPVES